MGHTTPIPAHRKEKQQKLNLKTYQFITMCKGDINRHQNVVFLIYSRLQ